MNVLRAPDLTLMTCMQEPLDVLVDGGPPEAIGQVATCSIKPLVTELVMSLGKQRPSGP